ncbi:hypothetical protein Q3G72_003299 [Acer saccharum]|nr:hypothetical protein Q3G72_003299 [Acer saccharum]
MEILNLLIFAFLGVVALTVLVHAQTQLGFISIDCGLPENSAYTDKKTGINYTSDVTFTDTGVSYNISSEYNRDTLEQPFLTVRSFPEGLKNCYTLKPAPGYSKFLIRASFMYGNYDGQNTLPSFDLLLGADVWDSVELSDASTIVSKEIIHVPPTHYVDVCLGNKGSGTPFLSSLELRPLVNSSYPSNLGTSLLLYSRLDVGSTAEDNETYRFKDDAYDRICKRPIIGGEKLEISIDKTEESPLPPILNALELYQLKQFLQLLSNQEDVDAILNIKTKYGVKRNWQGDPCAPVKYLWQGLNCSYPDYTSPRITSLNLSSSGISGEISSYISDLKLIQSLDLSNNNLTGPVPDFLSQLPFLTVLNLRGNNLQGSIPAGLCERRKNDLLSLSVDGNPDLCLSTSCTKKKNVVVPVLASIVAVSILVAASISILWILKIRKEGTTCNNENNGTLQLKNRRFLYSEVARITDNFERIIGRGGFGTVYHGNLDDTQVAVKMLSPSSVQGYKQFQAEVELLMRVHHKNLTTLVGYCDDGTHKGMIYEFMANGNLESHLLDEESSIADVLSWEGRLRIATETAEGLEYLHCGLIAGTPGYLDPEYYTSNRLTEKSDVYSFGVIIDVMTDHNYINNSSWQLRTGLVLVPVYIFPYLQVLKQYFSADHYNEINSELV